MTQEKPIVLLINGPNLNMLGKRNREQYGSFTLEQVENAFEQKAISLGVQARFFQSNHEGEIVSEIQDAKQYAKGIVINAGAHTHYSYAILDALELCGLPAMEVHISNIHAREAFRNISVILPACVGQVYGLGMDSYLVGLEKLCKDHIFDKGTEGVPPVERNGDHLSALSDLRYQITSVDAELMEIFNRRMSLAEQVAHLKIAAGTTVYDAGREAEVATLARQRADENMASRVDSMMKTMMRISRERQYDILLKSDAQWALGRALSAAENSLDFVSKVAYAGTRGAYSQAAAEKLFPGKDFVQADTFSSACDLLENKKAHVAVLPVENTIAGTVDNVFELLQRHNLYIVRAISIEIKHKLAVVPGTKLSDIRNISSHPQGLAQCSDYIIEHGWAPVVSDNTAFSAREVASRKDKAWAAISSEEAAKDNGLEILPVDICNAGRNRTRFIAVAKNLVITKDADRISTMMHLPHQSGALVSALQVFADRGLNLSSISSRPIPNSPGAYAFFLDFFCPSMGQEALLALYQLSMEMPFVKVLGWYFEEE